MVEKEEMIGEWKGAASMLFLLLHPDIAMQVQDILRSFGKIRLQQTFQKHHLYPVFHRH
jgi:hypothetical protein